MQEYVVELLRKWNLHPFVWNLILVTVAILLGLLINKILSLFIRNKNTTSSETTLKHSFFKYLTRPLSVFLSLLALDLFLPVMRMNQVIRSRLDHAMEIALIVVFAWLLIMVMRVAQDFVHRKVNIDIADNLRQRRLLTQLIYIRQVLTIIIILLAISAVLLTFDTMRKLGTGLLAGVGLSGIIIGFAAQKSLGNLLAGFQIAFTQPIRIDDQVVVEGQFGEIEEITLTYVVVKVWDERRLILPITYFIEKPFENWTRRTSAMHGTVYLYTDYSLPVDWLRSKFLQLVQGHPLWDGRTASMVVTDLKQDVMEIRALVSSSNSGNLFDLRCYLREQLIKAIAERYPQSLPLTRAEWKTASETPEK